MNDVLAAAVWRKSTRSNTVGQCVEVADLAGGTRAVRDSKDLSGPALRCTPNQWSAFTAAVRTGEFG